jgi:hypothetical protein
MTSLWAYLVMVWGMRMYRGRVRRPPAEQWRRPRKRVRSYARRHSPLPLVVGVGSHVAMPYMAWLGARRGSLHV